MKARIIKLLVAMVGMFIIYMGGATPGVQWWTSIGGALIGGAATWE